MDNITLPPLSIDTHKTDKRSERLRKVIGNLFDQLDAAALDDLLQKLNWIELGRGEVLCKQGEAGESLFILITGRLRAIVGYNTKQEREVGEISPGETVGEMSMITGEPRTATIVALRESRLVSLLKSDFNALVKLHPEVLLSLSRLTINRLNYTMHHTRVPAQTTNIALVPASQSTAAHQLVQQLLLAMQQESNIQYLHKALLPPALTHGADASDDEQETLNEWLVEQEMDKDYVIYEAEPHLSLWTKQCLKHADKIIVLKDVTDGPELTEIETILFGQNEQHHTQSREIVVLYPEHTEMPALTHTLLAQRPVKRHYNIRMNDNRHVHRLARMVVDKGIGLVLGGGGAKGFAHFGIYRALQETNVPVDMVCGTSMGAIIAAAIACEWNAEDMLKKGRSAFVHDKPLNDYTLPILSLIKGHKLQKINRKYFGDYHIEDLWLNFFCISSNLTLSEMVIHEHGPLWKAVTASVSIPGVLPPVVDGNNLLVDGASFNNFPVDIMKAKYGGRLIGVTLLADREYKLNYTNLPGGWHMLFSRFLPFLRRYKAPGIASIMLKSTILSSMMHQRKQVDDLELCLSPPVSRYSLLDLNSFDRVVETGYKYAHEVLAELSPEKLHHLKSTRPYAAGI